MRQIASLFLMLFIYLSLFSTYALAGSTQALDLIEGHWYTKRGLTSPYLEVTASPALKFFKVSLHNDDNFRCDFYGGVDFEQTQILGGVSVVGIPNNNYLIYKNHHVYFGIGDLQDISNTFVGAKMGSFSLAREDVDFETSLFSSGHFARLLTEAKAKKILSAFGRGNMQRGLGVLQKIEALCHEVSRLPQK